MVLFSYPDFSALQGIKKYPEYCKYQLRRYKAVSYEKDLIIPGCNQTQPKDEDWVKSWEAFMEENLDSENLKILQGDPARQRLSVRSDKYEQQIIIER